METPTYNPASEELQASAELSAAIQAAARLESGGNKNNLDPSLDQATEKRGNTEVHREFADRTYEPTPYRGDRRINSTVSVSKAVKDIVVTQKNSEPDHWATEMVWDTDILRTDQSGSPVPGMKRSIQTKLELDPATGTFSEFRVRRANGVDQVTERNPMSARRMRAAAKLARITFRV